MTGDAGFNRVVWDLRASAPEGVPNARGPYVVPGNYRVQLAAAGAAVSAPLQVEWDPNFPLTDEERRRRFQFLTDAGQLQKALHEASTTLGAVRPEVTKRQESLKSMGGATGARQAAEAVASSLEQIQRRIGGGGGGGEEEGGFGGGLRSQANGLVSEIDGGGVQQGTLSGPTAVQIARLAAVNAEVEKLRSALSRVLRDDLNGLNTQLEQLKLPRIAVPPSRSSSSSPFLNHESRIENQK